MNRDFSKETLSSSFFSHSIVIHWNVLNILNIPNVYILKVIRLEPEKEENCMVEFNNIYSHFALVDFFSLLFLVDFFQSFSSKNMFLETRTKKNII